MRWIFYTLITLNAALLVWRYGVGLPDALLVSPAHEPRVNAVAHNDGPPLVLLAEAKSVERNKGAATAAKPKPKLCRSVGPFGTANVANDFLSRLKALDVRASVRSVEAKSGATHWVYLPPAGSRQGARRLLAELQARGLDSYIIPKGELENGISLGVFSRLDLAEGRQKELAAQGLNVEVQSVERSYQELWVTLEQGEEQKIAEKTWLALVHDEFSLKEQENFCLDVASGGNIH